LYVALGRMLEMSGQYAAALEHYVEMEAFARVRAHRPLELAALLARGTIRSAPTAIFDAVEAQALAERALLLAQELHDRNAEAHIMANRALLSKFEGDWHQMVVLGERAAALARDLNLRDLLAHVLNDTYSAGLMAQGDAPRARQALSEANAIWRELENQPMLADNLGTTATFESTFGNYDAALAYAEEAYRISCSIDNLWNQSYALWTIGEVSLYRGEMDRAIRALQDAISLGERAGFAVGRVFVRAILALAYAYLGDYVRGLDHAREAVQYATEEMQGWLVMPVCALALVQTWAGQIAEASETLEQARPLLSELDPQSQVFLMLTDCELAVARGGAAGLLPVADRLAAKVGAMSVGSFLGWALSLKGEILHQLGHLDEARDVLEAARAVEEAHQGRNVLWLVLARLSAVEDERGDGARALALRQEARTVLEFILAHTSAPELRASFLARPDVHALLDA